jgi:hypothetical protein
MPRILDRLPIATRDDVVFVRDEMVRVKGYEVVVWVSLTVEQALAWEGTPRIPAILDTAHTHNFSIREEQLIRWAGLRPEALRPVGHLRHEGRRLPLHAADVWLHPNRPGHRDQFLDRPPFRLELPRGIAVYPSDSRFPRLPLLGLRALISNRLHLAIDGARALASLRIPGRWWLPW